MTTLDTPQKIIAAPWQLIGNGYIMLYRFSPGFVASQGFIPDALLPDYQGGFSSVMLVDYHDADVGPYQELLFIPGRFEHAGHSYYSISKIYVSTIASVLSGRHNWGIPKELADFEFESTTEGRQRVRVSKAGALIADFNFQTHGPRLLVTTRLLPQNLRTLLQQYDDKFFFTAPGGSGFLRYTRLLNVNIASEFFPDLSKGQLLASMQASNFHLCFPEAEIQTKVKHAAGR